MIQIKGSKKGTKSMCGTMAVRSYVLCKHLDKYVKECDLTISLF
jgi:hypothetical protein